jgi:hypothetical protein
VDDREGTEIEKVSQNLFISGRDWALSQDEIGRWAETKKAAPGACGLLNELNSGLGI